MSKIKETKEVLQQDRKIPKAEQEMIEEFKETFKRVNEMTSVLIADLDEAGIKWR